MAYLKQPWLLPERGKPEPLKQSWLLTVFPWAPGANKTGHQLAPLKKNTNAGTIHYLELVGGQHLPLQKILSCRYDEGRLKVQHTSAGVSVVPPSLSLAGLLCRLCKSVPAARHSCSAVFAVHCVYLTIGWFYIFNKSVIFN